MGNSTIAYTWRNPEAKRAFRSGVSLHSHTNQSKEWLAFVAKIGAQYSMARPLLARIDRWSREHLGTGINFAASYWTPPLPPKLAFDLERDQLESLDLAPMVSITDHDTITAPVLLRSVYGARDIPVSFEWSVPYGEQSFHLGVHNLPAARATKWMSTLAAFTAEPDPARLTELLVALGEEREVLLVFNHPMWDLYLIGRGKHRFLVNEFLQKYGSHFHALELNGLRNWDENRATCRLAEQWHMELISGGDRHGTEPNAAINLTNASCFSEFVGEIRRKQSAILFLPQYAEPWKLRMLQSTIDAVRYFPEFPLGLRHWDERIYHPDANGIDRPLRELWAHGAPPLLLQSVCGALQLVRRRLVSGSLRMMWSDSHQLQMALGDHEV